MQEEYEIRTAFEMRCCHCDEVIGIMTYPKNIMELKSLLLSLDVYPLCPNCGREAERNRIEKPVN